MWHSQRLPELSLEGAGVDQFWTMLVLMTENSDKTKLGRGKPAKISTRSVSKRDEAAIQAILGDRLRSYYDDVAREPIPDRFMDLLNKLDSAKPKDK